MQLLEEAKKHIEVVAVDRQLEGRLLKVGHVELLLESGGHVMVAAGGRRLITRPVLATGTFKNRVLRAFFSCGDGLGRIATLLKVGYKVDLATPGLTSRRDVELVRHSIFDTHPLWAQSFDLVRVANLLNLSYFDQEQLSLGIANAASWVRPGGLLAICRTNAEGRNNATLFRRKDSGLGVVERLGSGSEVEDAVLRG
jgi:hypothetical protein